MNLAHALQSTLVVLILTLNLSAAAQTPKKPSEEPPLPASVEAEQQTAKWAQSWWLPRHEAKVSGLKKQDIDLLMVGDSITHRWETVGKTVWDEYYGKRNTYNIGFNGDRTENVIWRLRNNAVKSIAPKVAVVMIGTNNAGHRKDTPEDTARGIMTILTELRTRLPKTKVLLLAIFPCGLDKSDNQRQLNTRTNKIIAKYADDKNVFYLDLSPNFLDEEGVLSKKIMPDLLHPNDKGYRIWAEAMEPTLRRLMGEIGG